MFNHFEPNVDATIAYLRLLRVRVNNATVNETLQNHPDWPSLLCIADSLTKWGVHNAAAKADKAKIDELTVPFLAHTNNRETPLAIVSTVEDETIHLYQANYKKLERISKEDFLKQWSGVYLIAEPGAASGEPNYKANKQKAFLQSLIPAAAFAVLVIFSFVLLNTTASQVAFPARAFYLQYLVLLAGVAVTSLLLWYEIDKTNPLLQKVCTGITKGNCNAILTGGQSKLFNWLSWSEIGFFYFTGSMLFLVSTGAGLLPVLAWLNILALLYTIFSVYYQWRVAKQWCVLCLAVQILLVLGAVNILFNNLLFAVPFSILFSVQSAFYFLSSFLVTPLIWFAVKPYFLRLQEAKNTKREFLRIKFNTEIFEALLKKQKRITIPTDGVGIDIGNLDATNQIIKVCNPYCGPCATAHPKIEEILENNKNVKAKIIFTTPNDETNKALKPVKHLLAVAAQNNVRKTKQSLNDWYLPTMKDYEIFAAKYKMNGELSQQGSKIEVMDAWCKTTGIAFTPTIFLNGYQLPNAYSVADLEYLLKE